MNMRSLAFVLGIFLFVAPFCAVANDAPFGSESLRMSGRAEATVGVVDGLYPATALSGAQAPYYRLTLSRTFQGTERDVIVAGQYLRDIKPYQHGAIVFLYAQADRYSIHGEKVWVLGHYVWTGGAEQERAIEDYYAHTGPEDRLAWAKTYLTHSFAYLQTSAWMELGALTDSPLRQQVLDVLLASKAPMRVHYLASSYYNDPRGLAALIEVARDAKAGMYTRQTAAEAAWRGQPELFEAWRDGKEGADAFLTNFAQQRWSQQHPPAKPTMTETDFKNLQAQMDASKRKLTPIHDVLQAHQPDVRFFALLVQVMDDSTQWSSDRELAYSYCRDLPFAEVGEALAERALDTHLAENFRFQAVFALCMGRHPNRVELLKRIVAKSELEKHRNMAQAMLGAN